MGGPDEEHLRRLVARLVHEEVEKILREKGEGHRPQPPHRDGRPESRR
jgi:hypothetical protein